ncbi:hypothetical protein [Vibrio rotiferianus]|uniref:hypothetical protein n=1 Tax=Vibrio rotiferianus TaxID=190895 RepID=UPI0005EEFE19|nr:hypothetical protein [Vibrio rotiferianus]
MIFDGIKYRNPIAYYLLVGVLASSLIASLTIGGYKLYQSELLYNFRMGVYYKVKATFLDGRTADWVSPERHFSARVRGYRRGGFIVLQIPTKEVIEAQLADLIILNEESVAKYINRYRNETVYVDYYEYDADGERHSALIIWEESGAPMNLSLIDSGLAKPTTKPPTNIVHKLFAEYYLGKLF